MKKTKSEKHSIPVSISATKQTIKCEALFTPYKIQWDSLNKNKKEGKMPTYIYEKQGESHKAYFDSMKTQFMTMKKSVEKLLRNQKYKSENMEVNQLKIVPHIIGVNQQVKLKINPRLKNPKKAKKVILGLSNNQSKDKQFEINEFIVKNIEESYKNCSQNTMKAEQTNTAQETKQENSSIKINNDYKVPLIINKQQIIQKKEKQSPENDNQEFYRLLNQNKIQINLINELEKQNEQLKEVRMKLTMELQSLNKIISDFQQTKQKIQQFQNESQKLGELYQKQLNNSQLLISKRQQLQKIHNVQIKKLKQENQSQKKLFDGQIQKIKQQKSVSAKKLQDLQTQLQEIKKESIMKDQKNTDLEKQLQKNKENIKLLNEQNNRLKQQTYCRNNQRLLCQKNYRHENSMKLLGIQFQEKINYYIEENISLKQKNNDLNSQVEALVVSQEFMKKTLQAYENRQKSDSCSSYNIEQYNNKIIRYEEKIKKIQTEKQDLIEQHELKIMELENVIDDYKTKENFIGSSQNQKVCQNFNKALKNQLEQNQELRLTIKTLKFKMSEVTNEKNEEICEKNKLVQEILLMKNKNGLILEEFNQLKQKQALEISCLKNEVAILLKKQETLQTLIASKNQQIKEKDQFIKNSLGKNSIKDLSSQIK